MMPHERFLMKKRVKNLDGEPETFTAELPGGLRGSTGQQENISLKTLTLKEPSIHSQITGTETQAAIKDKIKTG